MTSHRPYRRALRWEIARDEILAQSGKQFDPDIVAAFTEVEDELREIRRDLARAA
jgi:response regulator RpfG family c-di-GMP phosphodiesterase